jgi:hypothetical protein
VGLHKLDVGCFNGERFIGERIPLYWLGETLKNKKTNELLPHDPELIHLVKEKGLDGK